MMKNIIIGIAIGIIAVTGYVVIKGGEEFQGGSVVQGSEYLATTTVATSAGTHWLAKGIANGGICVFGSIIVASSSATTLTLWNATSTTDIASTTITVLKAGIGEGTYTYDITCSRGLVVDTPVGFNGSYTITYR